MTIINLQLNQRKTKTLNWLLFHTRKEKKSLTEMKLKLQKKEVSKARTRAEN